MVKDLIELFKNAYEEHGDSIVLDIYKPKEGIYVKVTKDGKIESLYINEDTSVDLELYKWFRDRDYYSNLVDMNKPVSCKQIHSNNCYSIFVKKDIFPQIEKATNAKSSKDKKERLTYEVFLQKLKDYYKQLEDTKNSDEKTFLLEMFADEAKFKEITDRLNELTFKNYIKFFLDVELSCYKVENEKYLRPKIFNDNKYNIKCNEKILGLSNDNMGMNSKKIYLEHKSTKYKVPFRISLDEALVSKVVFDWLKAQETNNIYIPVDYDFTTKPELSALNGQPCYYVKINKGKVVTIEDFEYLSNYQSQIEFLLKNYLDVENLEAGYLTDLLQLEKMIDQSFFAGNLEKAYIFDEKKIRITGDNSERLRNLLIMNIEALHSYFRKGKCEKFLTVIDKLSFEAILIAGSLSRLQNAFNLRMSILKHYNIGGCEMADEIFPIRELVIERIKGNKELKIESDNEFYYISGQLAYYLLSKSKAQNKNFNMIEPFLRTKTPSEFKKQINNIFEYYNYAISIDDERFRMVMGMFEAYQAQLPVERCKDIFLAGFLSKNIMFIKKGEM